MVTLPYIKGWQAATVANTTGEAFVAAVNTTLTGVNLLVYAVLTSEALYGRSRKRDCSSKQAEPFGDGPNKVFGFLSSLRPEGPAGTFPSPTNVLGVPFVTELNNTAAACLADSVFLSGGNNGDTGKWDSSG